MTGQALTARDVAAIRRKATSLLDGTAMAMTADAWRAALERALLTLNRQPIRAVVLDYDGTLRRVDAPDDGPAAHLVSRLATLIDNGMLVAVATGRDAAIGRPLKTAFPRSAWHRLWVASCNGASVQRLDRGSPHYQVSPPEPAWLDIDAVLTTHPTLTDIGRIVRAFAQLTVVPTGELPLLELWHRIRAILDDAGHGDVCAWMATHSIDILAPGVSKRNAMATLVGFYPGLCVEEILCIGDRGCWPGNDVELLGHCTALSVDQPSSSLDRGWNVAPPDHAGPDATSYYLSRLRATPSGAFRIELPMPSTAEMDAFITSPP